MQNVVAKHRGDSWGYRGRWQVNFMNTIATLSDHLNLLSLFSCFVESVIFRHNIVVVHELSHIKSGVRKCWSTDGKKTHWDAFLEDVVR